MMRGNCFFQLLTDDKYKQLKEYREFMVPNYSSVSSIIERVKSSLQLSQKQIVTLFFGH